MSASLPLGGILAGAAVAGVAAAGLCTYAALSAEFDARQTMDVVFTVGAYEVFAMALRTFDVDLDDDLLPYA